MIEQNKPPRLWHKAFWVGAWEARKVSEWDGRCWGVFALSGVQTTACNALWAFLIVQWSIIKAAFSSVISKIAGFFVALLEVLAG